VSNPAPKRRWFRFGLRRILFWDVPYVALMAAILGPWWRRPPTPMTSWLDLEGFAEGLAFGFTLELAALITLAWLLLPIAMWSMAWIWRRWKNVKGS
jgi:hypothetical protein